MGCVLTCGLVLVAGLTTVHPWCAALAFALLLISVSALAVGSVVDVDLAPDELRLTRRIGPIASAPVRIGLARLDGIEARRRALVLRAGRRVVRVSATLHSDVDVAILRNRLEALVHAAKRLGPPASEPPPEGLRRLLDHERERS